jgi:hypothetical protein
MLKKVFDFIFPAALAVGSVFLGSSAPVQACGGSEIKTSFTGEFVGEFRHESVRCPWTWGDNMTVYHKDLTPDFKTFEEAQQALQNFLQEDIAKYGRGKLTLRDRNNDGITDQYEGYSEKIGKFFLVTVGSESKKMFIGEVGSGK